MSRRMGARPTPGRLAELELFRLEAEVTKLVENDWGGGEVIRAIRVARAALEAELAPAVWRSSKKQPTNKGD